MELTRKNKGFEWSLWLALALAMCLSSCGARKKSLQVTKTETQKENDLSVFNQKNELGRVELIKLDGEIIIRPIDVKQPYRINNDVFDNVVIHIKQKKVDSVATVKKTETTKVEDKGIEHTSKMEKDLQIEKEGFDWGGLKSALMWIGLILILVFVIYFKSTGKRIFR
jgi:hypothetical protein